MTNDIDIEAVDLRSHDHRMTRMLLRYGLAGLVVLIWFGLVLIYRRRVSVFIKHGRFH